MALPVSKSELSYDAFMFFWRIITQIFFREIRPRGAFNIPKEGPVIFVGAPHSNQVLYQLHETRYPSHALIVSGSTSSQPRGLQGNAPPGPISCGSKEFGTESCGILCSYHGQQCVASIYIHVSFALNCLYSTCCSRGRLCQAGNWCRVALPR